MKAKELIKEKRYKLEIVSHRSRENEVISLIQSLEKNAFIVSYEPTQFRGGYITKQLKKTVENQLLYFFKCLTF